MASVLLIRGQSRDLGDGFHVSRLLPHLHAPHVGPFVFFDRMGPVDFSMGAGLDVRPHPHIGLATVTWLFEGVIRHRDSLGSRQDIHPGDVNWMIAGSGIVHSERTPPERRSQRNRLSGIQTWVALPRSEEERAPSFHHVVAAHLPAWKDNGVSWRLIAGHAYGRTAPVPSLSPMFYLQAKLAAGARLTPPPYDECGVYVVNGEGEWGDTALTSGDMAVLTGDNDASAPQFVARSASTIMLFGGEPPDGPRHLWWNFVSSSKARIERASRDWAEERFPSVPGDEHERIPLPER